MSLHITSIHLQLLPYPHRHAAMRPRANGSDATLLTNQFHFGSKELHGKQVLIGWYMSVWIRASTRYGH